MCSHERIVEDERFEDGSIDGRCLGCGERGFPIRDVAHERFMESEEGQRECGFLAVMRMEPEERARIAAEAAKKKGGGDARCQRLEPGATVRVSKYQLACGHWVPADDKPIRFKKSRRACQECGRGEK